MRAETNFRSATAVLLVILTSALAAPVNETEICSADSFTVNDDDQPAIWPWQSYVSSDRTPPWLSINQTGEPLAPGLILFAQEIGDLNTTTVKEQSPLIMTSGGDLVWAGPKIANTAGVTDFRTQTLFGQPVLTFWQGSGGAASGPNAGHGYGSVRVFDNTYNETYDICPQLDIVLPPGVVAPCKADVHEAYITEQNTILVTVYNITTADLTSVGGPSNGYVYDTLAAEIDILTGEPLWTWSALAHVPINASHEPLAGSGQNASNAYDWFHMNAIQPFEDYILINSRHVWATYLVKRSGEIVWQINGVDGGDFGSLPAGGTFSWQHHARLERISSDEVHLHYFANNNGLLGVPQVPSIGLTLSLPQPPDPANPPRLLTNMSDPKHPIASIAEGSFMPLENGNVLVGYGIEPFMKEFGPEPTGADVRWSAQFGNEFGAQNYRAYKSDWHAIPSAPPSLVAREIDGSDELTPCAGSSSKLRGYVSWNGATDVQEYRVFAGTTEANLKGVGQVPRRGFETVFSLPAGTKFAAVEAVSKGNSTTTSSSGVVAVQPNS